MYSRGGSQKIYAIDQLPSSLNKVYVFVNESDEIKSDDNISLRLQFGDLFSAANDVSWIPMIPDFPDGILHRMLKSKNGGVIELDGERVSHDRATYAQRVKSSIPGIPYAIVFNYSTSILDWNKVFECAIKVLKYDGLAHPPVLITPAFGTNNGFTFHDSALGIFSAIRSVSMAVLNDRATFGALKEIRVLTPYSPDQANSSCRTIAQLSRMIDIFCYTNANTREDKCLICTSNVCNVVLPCGHMFMCDICEIGYRRSSTMHGSILCMLCKKPYNEVYKSSSLIRMDPLNRCCDSDQSVAMTNMTYIPCGHTGVRCTSCEKDEIEECRICNSKIEKKLKVFTV